MIDILTVMLPHVLMALAIWRLLARDDLDQDPHLPVNADVFRAKRAKPKASQAKPPAGKPGHSDA
jgi:hypothetical protein